LPCRLPGAGQDLRSRGRGRAPRADARGDGRGAPGSRVRTGRAPRPSPAVDPTRNASILELSRRGTVSAHRKRQSILLGIALVAVAAFLVSFITGVRLPGRAGQDGSPFDGIPDAGGDRTR